MGDPLFKQIVTKKKLVKKKAKLKKNRKNQIFFTENGLKCIRNPMEHL